MFIQLTGFGRWTKCQFICLWWVIFLRIIHSYLIRDTNKKMLKTLYFVWSSGSPLFYLFDFILSEQACRGSDEWDSTRSAYRVSLRKSQEILGHQTPFSWRNSLWKKCGHIEPSTNRVKESKTNAYCGELFRTKMFKRVNINSLK